jgi:hypothetical protein
MRSVGAIWALVVAGLVAAAPATAGAARTEVAAPAAACPAGSEGVTVVVDFGNLPGGVQIRCVTEPVSSGFDALTKAGFSYSTSQRFPGMLCRIDGKPADEPCVVAPPGDRYWAYWTASEPGGAWAYSDLGAGNRTPPPGSVEGWAFSDGCKRRPQGPACGSPATTTTRPPTPTTRGSTGGSAGGGGTGAGGTPGGSSATTAADGAPGETTTTGAAAGLTSTTERPDGGRAPEPGEEADEVAAAESTKVESGGGGSPAGAVAAAGAAALIAGGTAVTLRRRRSAPGTS